MKKIREESKKAETALNVLKTTAQGAFMELGAKITDFAVHKATQIPAAIRESIEAFGQQEMAALNLSAAIRAGGGSVSEVLAVMSAFASEMQKNHHLRRRAGACDAGDGEADEISRCFKPSRIDWKSRVAAGD